jgi:hypothetical protein
MTCGELELDLMELARGRPPAAARAAAEAHIDTCARCAARLAAERTVSQALAGLADRHAGDGAAPQIEARLFEAFVEEVGPRRAPARVVRIRRQAWRTAAGVALAAGIGVVAWTVIRTPIMEDVRFSDAARPPALEAEAAEFVAWPLAPPLSALERGDIVRVPVPAAMLPALGIAPVSVGPGETLEADVIVGQDGVPRAVRIVRSTGP